MGKTSICSRAAVRVVLFLFLAHLAGPAILQGRENSEHRLRGTAARGETLGQGDGQAFEKVAVKPATAKKKKFPWLWVAGGVVVAVTVAAILLLGKDEEEGEEDENKDPDLQLEWLFSGNANDTSGKNRHGTIHGAVLAADRKGAASSAFAFNGVDQYIEGPNFIAYNVNQFTFSGWIRVPDISSSIDRRFLAGNGFSFSQKGKAIFFAISVPATSSAYCHIEVDQWTHLAGTFDGSNIRIYKNGTLTGMTSHTGNMDTQVRAFTVGFSSQYWQGQADDIRLYSRVLSDSEILQLYQN